MAECSTHPSATHYSFIEQEYLITRHCTAFAFIRATIPFRKKHIILAQFPLNWQWTVSRSRSEIQHDRWVFLSSKYGRNEIDAVIKKENIRIGMPMHSSWYSWIWFAMNSWTRTKRTTAVVWKDSFFRKNIHESINYLEFERNELRKRRWNESIVCRWKKNLLFSLSEWNSSNLIQ